MTNSLMLSAQVHEALVALGTCVAIIQDMYSHKRDLYYLVARCILIGHKIDFDTVFLTSEPLVQKKDLNTMFRALPQTPQPAESKRHLAEISKELRSEIGSLAGRVKDLDWCNKTLGQLFATGASEVDVGDCFTDIFMAGMRVCCPVQEFPSQWWKLGNIRTLDELKVMELSANIRKKPEWRKKLQDNDIVSKWREEAYSQDVTPSMFDFLIAELSWLAEQIDPETSIDYATVPDLFFSDFLIPNADRDALRSCAAVLGAVPDSEKDWHPQSNGQVLDLVHPSLYPYVHGRTPILLQPGASQDSFVEKGYQSTGSDTAATILRFLRPVFPKGLVSSPESALSFIGQGAPTSKYLPGLNIADRMRSDHSKYQWLPVDVEVLPGPAPSVRFLSYINNLHPASAPGEQLYPVLERILARFIPLFERTLTETRRRKTGHEGVRKEFLTGPIEDSSSFWDIPPPASDDDLSDETYDTLWEEYMDHRQFVRPTVAEFVTPGDPGPAQVTLGGRTLQIIIKMANVHLTPEKPEYEGGSWHVEGTENEQIVATGIYYYESHNIHLPSLEFRQALDEPPYEQNEFLHMEYLYGIMPEGEDGSLTNQHLGSVDIPEGRCICFPNGMQHRLSPFELMDRSKPGHRKILVFFLVDPSERILSTSHVPPQQLEWFLRRLRMEGRTRLSTLPLELFNEICLHAQAQAAPIHNNEPSTGLMTLTEAVEHRRILMDERAKFVKMVNESLYESTFNLCEH